MGDEEKKGHLSRRRFLKGLLAAGAAVTLPGAINALAKVEDESLRIQEKNTEIDIQSTLEAPIYNQERDLKLVPEASLKSSASLVLYNELSGSRRVASANLFQVTPLNEDEVIATFVTAAHYIEKIYIPEKFRLEIHVDQFIDNPNVEIKPDMISTAVVAKNSNLPASEQDIGVVSVRIPKSSLDMLGLAPFKKFVTEDQLRVGSSLISLNYPDQLNYTNLHDKYFVSTGKLDYNDPYRAYWMSGSVAGQGSSGGGVFLGDSYVGLIFGHGDWPNSILIAHVDNSTLSSLATESTFKLKN